MKFVARIAAPSPKKILSIKSPWRILLRDVRSDETTLEHVLPPDWSVSGRRFNAELYVRLQPVSAKTGCEQVQQKASRDFCFYGQSGRYDSFANPSSREE
jgi:hypothetical protein